MIIIIEKLLSIFAFVYPTFIFININYLLYKASPCMYMYIYFHICIGIDYHLDTGLFAYAFFNIF